MRKISEMLIAIALLLCLTAVCNARELSLSVLPTLIYDEVFNTEAYPLAKHLSMATGFTVRPTVERNIYEYKLNLQKGRYDIVFEDPGVGLPDSDLYEVIGIALNRDKKPKQRGVIITTTNSGISSVKDMVSRNICATHMDSAASYESQSLYAKRYGIDVSRDYNVSEVPDNKSENVIMYVYFQDYDAGFMPEFALKQLGKYVIPSQIKVIKTAWVANWIVAVKKDLPTDVKISLQKALLNVRIDKSDPLYTGMDISGFGSVPDNILKDLQAKKGISIDTNYRPEKNIW